MGVILVLATPEFKIYFRHGFHRSEFEGNKVKKACRIYAVLINFIQERPKFEFVGFLAGVFHAAGSILTNGIFAFTPFSAINIFTESFNLILELA